LVKSEFLKERIRHLDVDKSRSLGEIVKAMRFSSFQSRNLALCFEVYRNMLQDEDRPTIFLGLAGALVPGGMRRVVRDMITHRLVDVLVSTGANLYHDFCEAVGVPPYIGTPHADDLKLKDLRIDRIYDTYVDEDELNKVDDLICKMTARLEPKVYSTREYLHQLGRSLSDGESVLYAAADAGVPVFCPALNDSGIGIALTKYYWDVVEGEKNRVIIDPIRDNYEVVQIRLKSKKTGVVFVGGGTPKNYIQQMSVILDALGHHSRGHNYAVQITTDDPKWGGLSGCTFKEAQSWGKIDEKAMSAVVYIDATIGLPMLVGAVLQECSDILAKRKRIEFVWDEHKLVSMKQTL